MARGSLPDPVGGVLVVDKPEGPTSHDVVAVVRRVLGTRQVGHAGTLDPMATGTLVLVVGAATRLARFFSDAAKAYDATITLGIETDSGDRTGRVLTHVSPEESWPSAAAIAASLGHLGGTRDQVPPALSAKRLGGARAYDLARAGAEVALRAVPVTLHDARVLEYEPPRLRLAIRCSAGFYVRALARDLGRVLGCGATLEALRRTSSGDFTLDQAVTLQLLLDEPGAAVGRLVAVNRLLPGLPAAWLNEAGLRKAKHGNDLTPSDLAAPLPSGAPGEAVRLLASDGTLVGIATPAPPPAVLHPAVVLQ